MGKTLKGVAKEIVTAFLKKAGANIGRFSIKASTF